jgi:cardiolipin synthase A/B
VSDWLSSGYNWLSPFFPHLGFLMALVLMAGLLRQRRSPSSTIAWLLVILLHPYVGVPLYVIFGGRKMRRMARRKARIYQPATGPHDGDHGGAVERLMA